MKRYMIKVIILSLQGMMLSACSEPPMHMKTDNYIYVCKYGCQNYPSLWKGKNKIKLWRPSSCFDQCKNKPIRRR